MEAAPTSADLHLACAAQGRPALAVFSRFILPECARSEVDPDIGAEPRHAVEHASQDPALAMIAPYVDVAYYLASFPDDPAALRDPVAHFHQHGWRQGRDPAPWFDTRHYLASNDDVRSAGIDPLLHYLRNGRAEGRPPRPPGGSKRSLVDAAIPPARRRPGHDAPPGVPSIDTAGLVAALDAACLGRRGLVVALSHDRYIDKTGGVQIFIDDEEAQFSGDRFAYLHIAPIKALLTLAPEGDAPMPLQLTLGGRALGIALDGEVVAALTGLRDGIAARLLVVHSMFGHRTSTIAALAGALAPRNSFFWVHDYAGLCSGYNLLRNDAVYCGAPGEASMACRVCVYGEDRGAYRTRIKALFETVEFTVLAPSPAALDIWRRGAEMLPHRGARVHANAVLHQYEVAEAHEGPIRVAFVGFPTPGKGWPLFAELVARGRATRRFRFYHFANSGAFKAMHGLVPVPTRVDRTDRLAMAAALTAEDIDLVAVFSPWPETFSFVTHEALAAGADVVALAEAGGVVDAVIAYGRGVVLRSEADVLHFFLDGPADAYVRAQRAAGRPRARLIACGTTATLDPTCDGGPAPERLATGDPDIVVVAGKTVILPEIDGDRWIFDLPTAAGEVRIISRHTTPARLAPETGDHRRLGIAVRGLWLDGEETSTGDRRRRRGWHGAAAHDAVQWTSGDAVLETGSARRLVIEPAPMLTYQACPLGAGA